MDILPEPILEKIFRYEHQLRYADVMRELVFHVINCVFKVQLSQAYNMKYRHPDGTLRPCIDIHSIYVSSSGLLHRIRNSRDSFYLNNL